MRPTTDLARLAPAALLAALVGCTGDEPIVVYDAPKEPPTAAPLDAPAEDRMLAAIVPHGDAAWFFKVNGPDDAVAARKEDFLALVRSVTFDGETPKWVLPEGWRDRGASGMRFTTLDAPGEPPLEVSVTTLPMPEGDRAAYRLDNVNRWRRQMGLGPLTAEQLHAGGDLDDETVEFKLSDGTAVTLVNFVGRFSSGGMTPPFAGMGSGAPPMTGGTGSTSAPQDATLNYDVPEGWAEQPAGGFRKASFAIGGGEDKVDVSVIDLPAAANELLPNVNRWRQQVGLEPIKAADLGEAVAKVRLGDGGEAEYVTLVGPEGGDPRLATLGAVAVRGETAWFVKMTGPAERVLAEKAKFESFLKGLRFTSGP